MVTNVVDVTADPGLATPVPKRSGLRMTADERRAAVLQSALKVFARDGIAAEGTINQEQMIFADVDLDLLDEQRVNGSVIPLQDLIKDAYDNVVHFSDYKSQKPIAVDEQNEAVLAK